MNCHSTVLTAKNVRSIVFHVSAVYVAQGKWGLMIRASGHVDISCSFSISQIITNRWELQRKGFLTPNVCCLPACQCAPSPFDAWSPLRRALPFSASSLRIRDVVVTYSSALFPSLSQDSICLCHTLPYVLVQMPMSFFENGFRVSGQ